MATVGFIGLGNMGSALAGRLLGAGHDVVVWNRSATATKNLSGNGVTIARDPREALATGTVLSMLSNDQAVSAVFNEELLNSVNQSSIVHINMATVSLECAREMHALHEKHGLGYLAAPVLGRPDLAKAGQLNIIAAGAVEHLSVAEQFFEVMGKKVFNVGTDPEQANLVKLGVNYNLMHTLQALAESLNLVEKFGVNTQTFVELLTDTAYTGTAYGNYGPMIAGRNYSPAGFAVDLGLKDLGLVQKAAAQVDASLPSADVLKQIFEQTLADPELASLDWSAIAEITRRN